MKKLCYLFGAGEESTPAVLPPRDAVFVIAADGGYETASRLFGAPDLAVGDFDSLGYLPTGVPLVRHPAEKDDTDLALAAREAVERGYRRLSFFSALGGRLDHTVANLQLIARLAGEGCEPTLFGADGTAVTAIAGPAGCVFSADFCGVLSVLAHGGPAEGVTLEGLKYPLEDATLTPDVPLGVSNEFIGKEARISLSRGTLLLFYQTENGATPAIKNNKR